MSLPGRVGVNVTGRHLHDGPGSKVDLTSSCAVAPGVQAEPADPLALPPLGEWLEEAACADLGAGADVFTADDLDPDELAVAESICWRCAVRHAEVTAWKCRHAHRVAVPRAPRWVDETPRLAADEPIIDTFRHTVLRAPTITDVRGNVLETEPQDVPSLRRMEVAVETG